MLYSSSRCLTSLLYSYQPDDILLSLYRRDRISVCLLIMQLLNLLNYLLPLNEYIIYHLLYLVMRLPTKWLYQDRTIHLHQAFQLNKNTFPKSNRVLFHSLLNKTLEHLDVYCKLYLYQLLDHQKSPLYYCNTLSDSIRNHLY